jgi:hypothetical protein
MKMIQVPPYEYREFILFFQKISPSKRMKYKKEGETIKVRHWETKEVVCIEHCKLGMLSFEISENWYNKFKGVN